MNSYQVTLPKSLKDKKVELKYLDYNIKISYDNIDSNAFLKYDIDRNIENLHDSIFYQINDNAILKYDILNESIKENIILTNYIDNFSFSYFLETDLSFQNENVNYIFIIMIMKLDGII